MAAIVAVVGSKRSGKTTTVEALTRELTARGYTVAGVKHVSEADFTLDTKGKDTWKYARSGAKTIIAVSSDEIVTIERLKTRCLSLSEILSRAEGNDVVFTEGFRKYVGKERSICKIVVAKSAEEAREAIKTFSPILAFTGPYSTEELKLKIPYFGILNDASKLADLVENIIIEGRRHRKKKETAY